MHTYSTIMKPALRASTIAVFATLAACGGTDDPDIPFESKPITVSGTVATSTSANTATTALSVPVLLHCRNGHGTAMSDANGNYSVTTTGLSSGPCLVVASIPTGSTAVVLRAPAAGDGSRVNVTPLTEMLTQYIWARTNFVFPAGQSNYATRPPSELTDLAQYKDLMANKAELTSTMARVATVVQNNQAAPVVAVPADYLSGPLVAKTSANPGDAHSQVLEKLRVQKMNGANASATVVGTNGLPTAQILNVLLADARANKLP